MKTGSKHINRRIGYIARYGDFVMQQKIPAPKNGTGIIIIVYPITQIWL